jgi:outer membrane receptor protein involved in Fe transport
MTIIARARQAVRRPPAHRRQGLVSAIALIAALEAAASPRPARAADADGAPAAGGEHTLSEVVVTASRRQSNAISTPIDISALNADDLAREGVSNFHDLSRVVPGLVYNSVSLRDGGATNSFILHGLNLDSVNGNGGDTPLATVPAVSVYFDETPTFVNVHLADVQRVEVLRGPQATLYGGSSIGGTVRVLFNQPDLTRTSAEISGETSWTDHAGGPNYTVDGVINRPFNDELGLRVAAGYTFANGFISAPYLYQVNAQGVPILANPGDVVHSLPVSTSRGDVDDGDLAYVRPMLLYKKDRLKVLVTYQHQYEHSDGPDQDSYPGGPAPTSFSTSGDPYASLPFQNNGFDAAFPSTFKPYQTGDFILQPLTRTVDIGSVESSYDLGFATLTSVTSGYETTSHATDDSSGFYQKTLGFFYSGFPRLLLDSQRQYSDSAFVEEIRLVSNQSGPLTYTLGAFYMNERNHLTQTDTMEGYAAYEAAAGLYDTGTDVGYVYDRRIHFQDYAGFGELAYHITPRWQVTAGVRVFEQILRIQSINELPICGASCSADSVNPLGLTLGAEQEIKSKALMKFNTSYEFAPRSLAYFTFSQGERRGGANGTPPAGPFAESTAFEYFKPDSDDNYEVGVKSRINGRFEVSTSLYWVELHNPQVNVSTPHGSFPAAVNGAGARSRGIDFEARYKVTDDIALSATYGYVDARLTAPIIIPGSINNGVFVSGATYGVAGTKLPGTPTNTGSLGADYDHPLKTGIDFTAHADVSIRGGMATSLTPSDNVNLDGFAMLNLSAGLSQGAWRASLYANNVTNARGVLSAENTDLWDVRSINNRLSRPLTIGLRFGYKY